MHLMNRKKTRKEIFKTENKWRWPGEARTRRVSGGGGEGGFRLGGGGEGKVRVEGWLLEAL